MVKNQERRVGAALDNGQRIRRTHHSWLKTWVTLRLLGPIVRHGLYLRTRAYMNWSSTSPSLMALRRNRPSNA
jgi:hypothetical protein